MIPLPDIKITLRHSEMEWMESVTREYASINIHQLTPRDKATVSIIREVHGKFALSPFRVKSSYVRVLKYHQAYTICQFLPTVASLFPEAVSTPYTQAMCLHIIDKLHKQLQ